MNTQRYLAGEPETFDKADGQRVFDALESGRPFVRLTKEEFDVLLRMIHTAQDARGLPMYVNSDSVQSDCGTYILAPIVFYTRAYTKPLFDKGAV